MVGGKQHNFDISVFLTVAEHQPKAHGDTNTGSESNECEMEEPLLTATATDILVRVYYLVTLAMSASFPVNSANLNK